MIQDKHLTQAVSHIAARAERPADPSVLVQTFVDTGAIAQLQNETNQVLFGRRGSGKTHVLRVLQSEVPETTLPIYIDCRTLGSSGAEGREQTARQRAAAIFRDIFQAILDGLLERIVLLEDEQANAALAAFNTLEDELAGANYGPATRIETTSTNAATAAASAEIGAVVFPVPSLGTRMRGAQAGSQEQSITESRELDRRLSFSNINRFLQETLAVAGIERLLLLVDEWAEIQPEDQPFAAQY